MRVGWTSGAWIASVMALASCGSSSNTLIDAGQPDAGPSCTPRTLDRVDLLIVTSGVSYGIEMQHALGRELEPLLRALTTADVDGDGVVDQPPVRSLHVGVVTADLGAGDTTAFACEPGGDDAVLRTLQVVEAGDDLEVAATAIGEAVAIGNDDCFVSQPLEAALKALSPAAPTSWTREGYEAPAFERGAGHGDGVNAALLRDESVLAVLVLSAFEDASLGDPELYDVESTRYEGGFGTRFERYPEALLPVARYVEGVRALRRNPARIALASILGAPPDAIHEPGVVDIDALLAHPDMQFRYVEGTDSLVRACALGAVGTGGYPSRRMVEAARGLRDAGAHVVIDSVCTYGYERAIRAFARAIGDALTACE